MATGIGCGISSVFETRVGSSALPYANVYSVDFKSISSQYLAFPTTPLLGTGGTGAWTISIWFNTDKLVGIVQRIMSINQGGGGDLLQLYINSSDAINISGAWTDTYSTFPLTMGTWYNVIYRYNGNAATPNNAGFVMNGTNINNVSNKTWAQVGVTGNAFIGRNSSGGYFNGYLDEASIWDSYLTDAECIELYNAGTPIDLATSSMSANLQHWWRMGDPMGTASYDTIVDAKGSIDLTMTNMVASNIQTNTP